MVRKHGEISLTPAVSVLMAVYNGQDYLQQALDSILKQSFTDFEFIIVNDGSTDDTARILAAQHDPRLILLDNPENIGLTRSLNRALPAAQGQYIARQDADDISLPHRLATQVAHLDRNSNTILVSCDLEIINAQGKVIGELKRAIDPLLVRWNMYFYNHIGGHSQVMSRREAILEIGGYSESYRYSQDYDLWLRLMQRGNLVVLPDVWIQWRLHEKNISINLLSEQEQVSLRCSQEAIASLINENLDFEEIKRLRMFWMNPSELSLNDIGYATDLHRRLKQFYRAFVQKYHLTSAEKYLLRQHTAGQFALWTRSISLRHNPGAKLKVTAYIPRWSVHALAKALPERKQHA